MLKIAWTAVPLTVAGAHRGSWRASVLDVWSTSCTMLPDPAPYSRELLGLADGHASLKGRARRHRSLYQFNFTVPDGDQQINASVGGSPVAQTVFLTVQR